MELRLLVVFSLWSCQLASTAKILAFLPMPWRSHQNIFRPLIRELSLRGHEVDFYTPMPMPNPPRTLRQFKVTNCQDEIMRMLDEDGSDLVNGNILSYQQAMVKCSSLVVRSTLTRDKVDVALLQSNDTYDLVLSEFLTSAEATGYFAHKFQALNVALTGFPDDPWINEVAGLPNNPAYMVAPVTALTDRLDFGQRLYNLYVNAAVNLASAWLVVTKQQALADELMRYQGWETRPKIMEMISQTALILTNSHVSTGYAYPKAPHVKEISGMHISPPEPLPDDLQKFMDDAPDGVVYFSLGSLLNPKEILQGELFDVFLKVFRGLKQKVIWKLPPGMPAVEDKNIKVLPWCPQQSLLNHKNLKLFITHGGLQSTIESIAYGVPCLGMPFFFDQLKDVALLESMGMGRSLRFDNVTEATLKWSINEVLTNPKYLEQAKKRQALFHDRPMKPVDEAVYWIEYVLRHGNILRPASATMPFHQLYLLDVMGAILFVVVAILFLARSIVRALFKACRSSRKESTPMSKKKN